MAGEPTVESLMKEAEGYFADADNCINVACERVSYGDSPDVWLMQAQIACARAQMFVSKAMILAKNTER